MRTIVLQPKLFGALAPYRYRLEDELISIRVCDRVDKKFVITMPTGKI
jgi:hypothetical protein